MIEIGTEEPFELQGGRLVITYDPAIASGLPEVTPTRATATPCRAFIRRRAGSGSTSPPPWRLQPRAGGPDGDAARTPPGVPLGTTSPLAIDRAAELADRAGAIPLQVAWEAREIEFESDPGIFNDGFDGGDRDLGRLP